MRKKKSSCCIPTQIVKSGVTNLGLANRTSVALDVTSSSGTGITIPGATTLLAGLLSASDKVKINSVLTNADDGLSVSSGVVKLGGSLLSNRTIDLSTKNFSFINGSNNLLMIDGTNNTLGINTTSVANTQITIFGQDSTVNQFGLKIFNSSSILGLAVANNGFVGVGTFAPSNGSTTKFEVYQGSANNTTFINSEGLYVYSSNPFDGIVLKKFGNAGIIKIDSTNSVFQLFRSGVNMFELQTGSVGSAINMDIKANFLSFMATGGVDIGYFSGSTGRVLFCDNIATAATAKLHVKGAFGYNQFRLETSYTPTFADTNGNIGDITWDDNFIFWKGSAGWMKATGVPA